MNEFFLETPGKINLYLEVKGKMVSGYHELLTLFYPVALCDRVTLRFNDSGRITCSCTHPGVPSDERNLAVKAALLYFQTAQIPCSGLEILIEKNLPISGGMGSGSSDAGAVLRLLQEYTSFALEKPELARIALAVGSDVPFFLDPVPSEGRGQGEILSPLEKITSFSLPLLLIGGSFPISAAWAYAHWRDVPLENVSRSMPELVQALQAKDFVAAGTMLRNDLEGCVMAKFPLLSILKKRILETEGSVLLSGSGPTLFALYKDFSTRDQAYEYLQKQMIHVIKTS